MVWKMNKIPPSPDRAKGNQALCSRCLGGEIKNPVIPVNHVGKYFGFMSGNYSGCLGCRLKAISF